MATIQFSGLGSGINGVRIASAVHDELTTSNRVRESQVQDTKDESASLEELRTRLYKLASSIETMQTINGGAIAKKASSSNKDVANVLADSSATTGNYQLDVISLAKNSTGSFNRSFISPLEKILTSSAQAGTISSTVGSGSNAKTINVSVDDATSLSDFVQRFNEAAGSTASANIINVGTSGNPEYRVSFSSANTGTERGSITTTASNPALLADGALGSIELDQASNSQFKLSGLSEIIERSSNSIEDVVKGLTIELKSKGSITVSVQSDAKSSSTQLAQFVDAFNSLVTFVSSEDKITSSNENGENVVNYGSLSRTRVDDNALANIRSAISNSSSGDSNVSLAALGISTNRDGTLSFDEKKFTSAFNQNAAGAEGAITALADQLGGVAGIIQKQVGYGQSIDQELASNNDTINSINQTISRVEDFATSQQKVVENQFAKLEGLIAKMNSDAQFITSLLSF